MAGDRHGMNAVSHREFGDVPDLHKKATVRAKEPVWRPPLRQVRNRHAHQVSAAVDCVQPHVVALGFCPAHLLAGDKPGAPGYLDGNRGGRVVVRRFPLIRRVPESAPEGSAQACTRYRFEQVVACSDVEGANGVFLKGSDENDSRGRGEPAQDVAQLDAVECGHPDIEENDVVRTLLKVAERVAGILCRVHRSDRECGAEQVAQLVPGRRLVIDDERGGGACPGHCPLTAGQNLGRRIVTFVPAPTPVSMVSPWSLPKVARSLSSTLRSPTEWPPVRPASTSASCPGST